MLLIVELLVVLGIFWLFSRYLLRWWNDSGKVKRRYPPSLPSLPLVGSLPFLRGFNNIADFFMRKADQLGPIFTLKAGNTFFLILNSREVIEDALVKHSSPFSGRFSLYTEGLVNPNNKGLITMNTTQEWKKYHQLSLSILKQFGFGVKSTMESRILAEVESLTDFAINKNGLSFNPKELAYLSISNIIMNMMFGRRRDYNLGFNELGYESMRFVKNIDVVIDMAPVLRFIPFFRNKLHEIIECQRLLHKLLRMEIEKSLEDGAEDCFVRRYVESLGRDYDTEQLSFTLRDIIVGGTDTTASTLRWTLIALANHPDVQDRIRLEIDGVVPRDTLPSMNDQLKLPYVDATMLEILRWRPVGPTALPHMTLSDTSVGEYFVPTGTAVLINIYAAHMDPKVWTDPEIFRPERFLDSEGRLIGRESVISFSLGRRSCFGEVLARAELFLILAGLVQRFFIRPPEGQKTVDVKPIEPVCSILTPSEFNIRLISRD